MPSNWNHNSGIKELTLELNKVMKNLASSKEKSNKASIKKDFEKVKFWNDVTKSHNEEIKEIKERIRELNGKQKSDEPKKTRKAESKDELKKTLAKLIKGYQMLKGETEFSIPSSEDKERLASMLKSISDIKSKLNEDVNFSFKKYIIEANNYMYND